MDECLSDIETMFSEDKRFMTCKSMYSGLRSTNPKLIVTTWTRLVTDKYYDQIEAGNLDYFLNKDYREDLETEYTPTIDSTIHELRRIISEMSDKNKEKAMKYVQNLCKLSKMMQTADPNT